MNETYNVEELFPSLGYFGSSPTSCLKLQVGTEILGIRLKLGSASPEILNLLGMSATKNEVDVDLQSYIRRIYLSTDYFDREMDGAVSLLKEKGVHSKRELGPIWEIEFDAPIDIDRIRISNRPDEWGKRSSSLEVYIKDKFGVWLEIYSGHSSASVCKTMHNAMSTARFLDYSDVNSPDEFRCKLIRAISRNLLAGTVSITHTDWTSLIPLTNIWIGSQLTEDEWNIVGAKVLHEKIVLHKSNVSEYAFLLNSRSRIAALQLAINKISQPGGYGRFGITRHGLQSAKLGTHHAAFMELLMKVLAQLEDLKLEPFISYGTLLGARREGTFIDHDDDVDVVYLLRGITAEDRENEMEGIFDILRSKGYPVNPSPGGMNAHVFNQKLGIVIDIFPCWIEDGQLHLHMEKMKIRGISPELVYPRSHVDLNEVSVPAPSNVDCFLQERYGNDWQISDPYFEWQWPLKDDSE